MKKGKVAVIIPTHGGSEFIDRSIASVLKQDYDNIQIIVVDDNGKGTDKQLQTASILKKYIDSKQIIYLVHETNRNGSAARNTGAFYSDSEYITFLDDDDELLPGKIVKQVSFLDNNPEVMLTWCGGNILIDGEISYFRLPQKKEVAELYNVLLHKTVIGSNSLMIRRCGYESLGGFDESFLRHQDWEFTARVVERYYVAGDDFLGFNHFIVGRNDPQKPEIAIKYRKHYLEKMKPIMKNLTSKQIKQVIAYNMIDAMFSFIKARDFIGFMKCFWKEKLGICGITCLLKRIHISLMKKMS